MVYLLIQYVTIRTVANAAPTKRHAQSAMTDSVWMVPPVQVNSYGNSWKLFTSHHIFQCAQSVRIGLLVFMDSVRMITTCAGKFLMLRYGLFPTIYDNKVLHGFCADDTSYGSTFIIEQIFNLFSIIYCTVVRVLVVVVVVVYAVVMGVIEVGNY